MDNIRATGAVTEEQIRNDVGSFVYDIDAGVDEGVVNLPDVNVLLANVIEILEYSNSAEMVALRRTDKPKYNSEMERKYPQFSSRYFALFQQILEGEDLSPLLMMFAKIESVKSGRKTIEQVEKELGNALVDRYVPANIKQKIGGYKK
jgi:hypothetical protein